MYRKGMKVTEPVESFRDVIGTIAVVPFGTSRLSELQTLHANSCCTADDDIDHYNYSNNVNNTRCDDATSSSIVTIRRALQSSGRKLSQVRHLRRRATSYKRFKKTHYYCSRRSNSNNINVNHHRPLTISDDNKSLPQIPRRSCCRKIRRQNISQLCLSHETWWYTPSVQPLLLLPKDDYKIGDRNASAAAAATSVTTTTTTTQKWMTTHLYYRKRCHMISIWNWYVPLLHMNRGCAAALRLLTMTTTTSNPTSTSLSSTSLSKHSKCTLQDTTWSMQPIWFRIMTIRRSTNTDHSPHHDIDNNIPNDDMDNRRNVLHQFQTILQSMIPDFHLVESISKMIDTDTDHNNNTVILRSDDRCVMYEPFCFPRNAIGPVTWMYMKDYPIFQHHPTTTTTTIPLSTNECPKPAAVMDDDYLYFFVHPSIQSVVVSYLTTILQSQQHDTTDRTGIHGPYVGNHVHHDDVDKMPMKNPSDGLDVDPIVGALACFQLRGSNQSCFECIMKSLTKFQQQQPSRVSENLRSRADENTNIINCTNPKPPPPQEEEEEHLLPLYNFLHQSQRRDVDHHNAMTVLYVSSLPRVCGHSKKERMDSNTTVPRDDGTSAIPVVPPNVGFPLYLRRVCPRDISMPCNYGVCGYDIYCPPQYSKVLFQSFVLHGGACMIGIVEEAYMALECCPPMFVFPRDYPDTVEGQKYWNDDDTSVEWKLLRHYWEGGGGRISKIKKESLDDDTITEVKVLNRNDQKSRPKIIWNKVLGRMDDTDANDDQIEPITGSDVVVVRSQDFIGPFHSALSGCTNYINETKSDVNEMMESNTNHKTKKRRRHRSMNHSSSNIVEASRISIVQRQNHHLVCQSFIDHLSLPAVLMCSVQLNGKGTLHPGCGIYSLIDNTPRYDDDLNDNVNHATTTTCSSNNSNERNLLGWVTAGSFSMARGYCNGIAMIGAKAWLQAIVRGTAVDDDQNNGSDAPSQPATIVIHSCPLSKTKSVQLKVCIENRNRPSIKYNGTLSLL